MALEDILAEVASYGCHHVTVTGGEPLAQATCHDLLRGLADQGHHVSLETSGAIDVSGVDPRIIKVMDLKTPSSGELAKNLYGNIAHLTAQDQVKFVIGDDEDYQWAKAIMAEQGLAQRCQLLFSPIAGQQDPTELAEKILRDRLPVRFQIQLHKLLWQDAQGK